MARASHRPWWWTFTDEELSKVASHLAAGGSFCCAHNEDALRAVTGDKRKLVILAEHAYASWGCYAASPRFAGQGPYLRQDGTPWDAPFAEILRHNERDAAGRWFRGFMDDVSPRRGWPHPDGDLP